MNQALLQFAKRSKVQLLGAAVLGMCALPSHAVVFQAEDYAYYSDTTPGNAGGKYRSDNVDIEATNDPAGGGFNVGWIEANEWLVYSNLVIPSTGSYTIKMRVASPSGATASLDLNAGSTKLGDVAISPTGSWSSWTTVTKTVNLNAGTYNLGVVAKTGGWNFNWVEIVPNGPSTSLPTSYPGYTGVYPGYTLKLDDRFDNFNTAVWKKGDGAVGSESACRFTANGVNVVNGNLELTVRNEYVPGSWSVDHQAEKAPYNYSCGELRTVSAKQIKYGRIEARVKAPSRAKATGYIASLFTYTNGGSPRTWEEIDIEMEGGRPDMFQANLIYGVNVPDWWSTRQWGAWEHKIWIAPADDWRVYAIEWAPTFMKWYVDGVLVKTLDQNWLDCNPSCVAPQVMYTPVPRNLTDLMMNFWIPSDSIQNAFGGNKSGNVYPMVTQYDWVRIYQLDSAPLNNY